MALSQSVRIKTLIGSAAVLALFLLMSVGASRAAAAYGELKRIGETTPGSANGQLSEERTRLLGVDPTDNSVYVLDEPTRFTQTKQEVIDPETKACEINEATGKCVMEGVGPITRHFRLQKFTESKGKYAFAASASFDEVSPEPHSGSFLAQGVEGLAIDPKLKRVYLLTVVDREKSLAIDKQIKSGGSLSTEGALVASTLHAFSTEANGTELVAASGTKKTAEQGDGVLVGPTEFHAQSTVAGQALLQPTGITVDPATDEVIVLGHIDEKGEATDDIGNSGDHYALQRISQTGTLGTRYLDKTNFLKGGLVTTPPDSPVVIPGASEHVDVDHEGIAEIPYDFASTEAPHQLSSRLGEAGAAIGPRSSYSRGASIGGALSAAPDGTLYASGEVRSEEPGVGIDFRPGVLSFAGATGTELGWTGGQTPLLGNKDKCVLQPELEELVELPLRVAAGSESKVFALNPEFLKRWEGEEAGTLEEEEERAEEGEKTKGAHFPAIVEFGPGGTDCPPGSVTTPIAEVNGKSLTEKEPVAAGVGVTFSSTVKQADALKVKWEFSNGTVTETETQTTDQFRSPTISHKFEHEGMFTVKETVETDNLDTPTLTAQAAEKVQVSGVAPPPPAALEGPSSALVSQTVTFTDPNPSGVIKKYKWSFGDGAKSETEAPSAKHAYAAPGEYTVELKVANSQGTEGTPATRKIKVTEATKEPPKEEPKPAPEEKHESAPTTPPPGGGVQGKTETKPPLAVPNAVLAKTSASVSSSGVVSLSVSCPAGESSCAGTVTLRTLTAVSAAVGGRAAKKAVLVLATGSFSVAGGKVKSVTLRLSAKAKKLLAKAHVLRARATIVAHDAAGASHTSQATVTLRAAKKH